MRIKMNLSIGKKICLTLGSTGIRVILNIVTLSFFAKNLSMEQFSALALGFLVAQIAVYCY